jgi:hypothetical protein
MLNGVRDTFVNQKEAYCTRVHGVPTWGHLSVTEPELHSATILIRKVMCEITSCEEPSRTTKNNCGELWPGLCGINGSRPSVKLEANTTAQR